VWPARFWGGAPPLSCAAVFSVPEKDQCRWWLLRASLGFAALVLVVAGGVVADRVESELAQALGVGVLLLGIALLSVMFFGTLGEGCTGDGLLACSLALAVTVAWGIAAGSALAASSDGIAHRFVGVLTVIGAILVFLMLLVTILVHVLTANHEDRRREHEGGRGAPLEDGDPTELYTLLLLTTEAKRAHDADAPIPTLAQLVEMPELLAWSRCGVRCLFASIVMIFVGGTFKAVAEGLGDNLGDSAKDAADAAGEVLACAGAAALLYVVVGMVRPVVPTDEILKEGPHHGVDGGARLKNGLATVQFMGPVLVLDAIWLLGRGGERIGNAESLPERIAAAVVMTMGGIAALLAGYRAALVYFGLQVHRVGPAFLDPDHASCQDRAPAELPAGAVPPDEEMMPIAPRAFRALPEEVWRLGLGIQEVGRVLATPPWKKWWEARMRPVLLFAPLAIVSGVCGAVKTHIEDPMPWVALLLPFAAELCGAAAALAFSLGFTLLINFAVLYRPWYESVLHLFNFIWLALRSGHDSQAEDPAQRFAGVAVMLMALQEARWLQASTMACGAMVAAEAAASGGGGLGAEVAALLAAGTAADTAADAAAATPPTWAGDAAAEGAAVPPRDGRRRRDIPAAAAGMSTSAILPVVRLSKLLKPGQRFSAGEALRELHRDPELHHWMRRNLRTGLVCALIAFAGGLLKDDVALPVLDLVIGGNVDEEKRSEMQRTTLRPIGSALAAIGGAMLLQIILVPIAEAAMFVGEVGHRMHRDTAAAIAIAGVNSLWLAVYAAALTISKHWGLRVTGILLTLVAGCCAWAHGGERRPLGKPALHQEEGGGGHLAAPPLHVVGGSPTARGGGAEQWEQGEIAQEETNVPRASATPNWKSPCGSRGTPRTPDGIGEQALAVASSTPVASVLPVASGDDTHLALEEEEKVAAAVEEEEGAALRAGAPEEEPPVGDVVCDQHLLARLGLLEPASPAQQAPAGPGGAAPWRLTPLGASWLLANLPVCLFFFIVCCCLQGHWSALRGGEVDERALAALLGAAGLALTVWNVMASCWVLTTDSKARAASGGGTA